MKKFFLNLLSSFLGAWIALVLLGALTVFIIFAIAGKLAMGGISDAGKVKSKSVLVLNLDGIIEESETAAELDYTGFILSGGKIEKPQTLRTLVTALKEATDDKRIKALYVKCGNPEASPATLHALRESVREFKEAGKTIYAYGDVMTQGSLYVASLADSIFVNPQGSVEIHGVGGGVMYMKGLLDKIGVEMEIFKVGTYKSAVEPYTRTEMSEPARAQLDTLYGNIWREIKTSIAKSRSVQPSLLDSLANVCAAFLPPAEIVKTGLIHSLSYEREMDGRFALLLDEDKEDVNFVSTDQFVAANSASFGSGKHIAVLYATGEIQEMGAGGINCYELVPVITELAEDDDVKGLVLRVNSPGGSVFGSQQIADALAYFKSTGKPFTVSMGDYAASGGYWISADADRIFADPLTITGSIGIFGMIPNGHGLMEKLGLNMETVSTNPDGLLTAPYGPLSDGQKAAMTKYITLGYDQFINRVAKGRNLKSSYVRTIAEGRVWDGATACKLGLVDELGSLAEAVAWTGEKCDLGTDAPIRVYPEVSPSFWSMVQDMGSSAAGQQIREALGNDATVEMAGRLYMLISRRPVQALMPEMVIKM